MAEAVLLILKLHSSMSPCKFEFQGLGFGIFSRVWGFITCPLGSRVQEGLGFSPTGLGSRGQGVRSEDLGISRTIHEFVQDGVEGLGFRYS